MLLRLLSIVVLAPPLLWLIVKGGLTGLYWLLLPVTAGLLWEWHHLRPDYRLATWLHGVAGAWVILTVVLVWGVGGLPVILTLWLGLGWGIGVVWYGPSGATTQHWGHSFAGLVYCAMPMALILDMVRQPEGEWLIVWLLGVIWATDVGAYLFGRAFGKSRLAPQISPGKTWAGLRGGLLSAMVAGWLLHSGFSLAIPGIHATILALVLGLVGQIGDLAESWMKREAAVKDSGRLIPGHGGLLDRLDSLLFAAPVLALYVQSGAASMVGGVRIFGG